MLVPACTLHIYVFTDGRLFHFSFSKRRGLEFRHIDPLLYPMSKNTINDLRTYYGDRLGIIYIVYANWLFWTLFQFILKPFLLLISRQGDRMLMVADEKGKWST